MKIEKRSFGRIKNGEEAFLYTITNRNGMRASVTDFGASLTALVSPDGTDVVLGFDCVTGYETNPSFFGSSVGRNANRTKGASFEIGGKQYQMPVNENENNLHTDIENGFHKKLWTAEISEEDGSVSFHYLSPDGEYGFPGNLDCTITYQLTEANGLKIIYEAQSDADTIYNPTNHSYFNLSGHAAGSILHEELTIDADAFTEIRPGGIPTGRLIPVKGTPMDFRTAKVIGKEIDSDDEQLLMTGGYDHNWCLNPSEKKDSPCAVLSDKKSGIRMEVYTDRPGLQVYAGNFIDPQAGKGGAFYEKRHGIALETQGYPDACHHENFPSTLLEAGEHFRSVTEYRLIAGQA